MKKKKYKYKYKYLYGSIGDLTISNFQSLSSNRLYKSQQIFPQSVSSRLEKIHNVSDISKTYPQINTPNIIKIEVRNLIGDSCIVYGTEESVFYEFLNRVPMAPRTDVIKIPNIVVVHNGKKYELSTKWKNILKDGDKVHIYRKLEDDEVEKIHSDRLQQLQNKYITVGTQTEENVNQDNINDISIDFIWNLFLLYLLYFLLNQLELNIF